MRVCMCIGRLSEGRECVTAELLFTHTTPPRQVAKDCNTFVNSLESEVVYLVIERRDLRLLIGFGHGAAPGAQIR